MNILTKQKKKARSPNLVPLINIVFLLLIFFMLTGTLKRSDIFDISPPESSTGADAEAPELVLLILKLSIWPLQLIVIKILKIANHF